jgi:hypothetical protein
MTQIERNADVDSIEARANRMPNDEYRTGKLTITYLKVNPQCLAKTSLNAHAAETFTA